MTSFTNNDHLVVPSSRKIRRTCNLELYRTLKRLNLNVPKKKITAAEYLYFTKVLYNLPWIVENNSNRKKLADWWEENVCPGIAEIWDVEPDKLARAFRDAFGG